MTYVYRCKKCLIKFNVIKNGFIADKDPCPVCPNCNSNLNVEKLINPVNYILNGTGWVKKIGS